MSWIQVATAAITSGSTYLSWPSPSHDIYTGKDSPVGQMTDIEWSWVVSIFLLAGLPISPVAGILLEKIGRKKTLLLSAAFTFFPWILIIFATQKWMIYVARFSGGLGFAMATPGCAIYNGEIAENDIRGKLSSSFILMKLLGNFLVLTIGPFVSYVVLAVVGAAVPAIFFIVFLFMPESPFYLIKTGQLDEARKVLVRLSSNKADSTYIEKRMVDIQFTIDNDMRNQVSFWHIFTKNEYRKSLLLIVGIKTMQQMSGSVAIDGYMQKIIDMTGSSISPEISSIIFGIVEFIGAILCSILIDKLGRKPILIISALGCAVALAGEGTYFLLQDNGSNVDAINWLPTSGIVIYLISSNFGILNLPYILLGELFPTNIKSIGAATSTFYGSTLSFIVSKTFDPLSEKWGIDVVFYIYTGFCIAGSVFVYLCLPETKGKSFDQIQAKIHKNKKKVVVATIEELNKVTIESEEETKKEVI